MKKLTILTSLSCLMNELAFKTILLNSDKIDRYTRIYAEDFNRRLNRIKEKYEPYRFEKIEVINFFLQGRLKKEEQLEIEEKIINLVNTDNNLHYLNYENNDMVQDYVDYVNGGIISSLAVLDTTDMGRGDIIDLANALLLYNKNDFYIDFYDD